MGKAAIVELGCAGNYDYRGPKRVEEQEEEEEEERKKERRVLEYLNLGKGCLFKGAIVQGDTKNTT